MATQPTQNPVPSESPRDLKFNAGKIDEFVTSLALKYQDRFGTEHYTIEGLRQLAQEAIAAFGWITIDSFQDGAVITLPNQVLRDEATGEYYRWDGELPKEVPENSTPASTGGVGPGLWLSVGDATLRGMLSAESGAELVGTGLTVSFDTVADMKSSPWLASRMNVVTKGYFSAGDGGGASYVILNTLPDEVGHGNHELQNGLYAHISAGGTAYLEQWGALADDASDAIQSAFNAMNKIKSISNRTYNISKTIYIPSERCIDFSGSYIKFSGNVYVDFFMPNGSADNRNKNITIKNSVMRGFYTYGDTPPLPDFNNQGHGNGVVCIRMKYCDGFIIENIEASGGHYGIEVKTSTYGTIRNCTFHDNIDDGLSISDGGVVAVQSSDILVELCRAYRNGYSDNNTGNSGFEVDDGPRNITFNKCWAHNNESRGFACHVHAGASDGLVCYNIKYVECRAESNNNTLQTSPVYSDVNCGFAFSSASNTERKVRNISLYGCQTTGHKQCAVIWYKSGTATDGGLTVRDCLFSESLISNSSIRTSMVSDVIVKDCAFYGTSGSQCLRISDNRGVLQFCGNSVSGFGLENINCEGSTQSLRAFIENNEFIVPTGTSRVSPVISLKYCLDADVSGNVLRGGSSGSTASGVYLGNATSNATKNAKIRGNTMEGVNIGVFTRYTSASINGNIFTSLPTVLSSAVTASALVSFIGNLSINCSSVGDSGADVSSGNASKTIA